MDVMLQPFPQPSRTLIEINLSSQPSRTPTRQSTKKSRPSLPEAPIPPITFQTAMNLMVQQAVALDRRRIELLRSEASHADEIKLKDEQVKRLAETVRSLKKERDEALENALRDGTELGKVRCQLQKLQSQSHHSRHSQVIEIDSSSSFNSLPLSTHNSLLASLRASHAHAISNHESEKSLIVLESSRLKIELTQAKTEASSMKYPEDIVVNGLVNGYRMKFTRGAWKVCNRLNMRCSL